MGARAIFEEAKHPRGSHGRFGSGSGRASVVRHSNPTEVYSVEAPRRGLGRETRRSKLKRAATASHNRRVADRALNKGASVTPRDAAFRKARLAMGTHQRPGDPTWILPKDSRDSWVRLNWSKVKPVPGARSKMSGR